MSPTMLLSEAEETKRGELLVYVLNLMPSHEVNRYCTEWGTKTPLGIFRLVKRIIEEGA